MGIRNAFGVVSPSCPPAGPCRTDGVGDTCESFASLVFVMREGLSSNRAYGTSCDAFRFGRELAYENRRVFRSNVPGEQLPLVGGGATPLLSLAFSFPAYEWRSILSPDAVLLSGSIGCGEASPMIR